jgi:hypothetical protein
MSTHPKPPPLQTIASLTHKYNTIREIYTTSPFAIEIRKLINSHTWHINKAIALGIGSVTVKRKGFFKDGKADEDISVNLFRLACFLDVVGFLGLLWSDCGQRVFMRDQGFNELDVRFLKSLGVEVFYGHVDLGGEGFLFDGTHFGGSTLRRSLLEGLITESPVLYIGHEVDTL